MEWSVGTIATLMTYITKKVGQILARSLKPYKQNNFELFAFTFCFLELLSVQHKIHSGPKSHPH